LGAAVIWIGFGDFSSLECQIQVEFGTIAERAAAELVEDSLAISL
jgi:hypothetical protein